MSFLSSPPISPEAPGVHVVTGGSHGIGAATVALLAAAGHRVVSLDVVAPSSGAGRGEASVSHLHCDLASEDAVRDSFARIAQEQGHVNGLVNCAGVESRHLLENMPVAAWDRVMDINLRGTMLCLQAAAPLMREGAAVVNVASIAGKRMSYSGDAAYTASKGAVLAFTRHMAFELAGRRIRVNAVCPGPTLTPMIFRSLDQARMAAVAETVPLGRWVQADDVAQAIAFLLSPAAAMITGSTIDVDGGMLVSNGTPYRDYVAARPVQHAAPPSPETSP